MRVRDLMRELAELDLDAIVVTELPEDEFGEGPLWTCTEVVGVARSTPAPFVVLETERRP